MTVYDISHCKVRVILNEIHYGSPSKDYPIDVEGTVLQLMTNDRVADELYDKGLILPLVCDQQYEGCSELYVRWDYDTKIWLCGGTLKLRSSSCAHLSSIWPGKSSLEIDTRPYHTLRPRTVDNKPIYHNIASSFRWKTAPQVAVVAPPIDPVYDNLHSFPHDNQIHKVMVQGTLCRAQYDPGTCIIRWQEEGSGQVNEIPLDQLMAQAPEPVSPAPEYNAGGLIKPQWGTIEELTTSYTAIDITTPQPYQYEVVDTAWNQEIELPEAEYFEPDDGSD